VFFVKRAQKFVPPGRRQSRYAGKIHFDDFPSGELFEGRLKSRQRFPARLAGDQNGTEFFQIDFHFVWLKIN